MRAQLHHGRQDAGRGSRVPVFRVRGALAIAAFCAAALLWPSGLSAQEITFLRIGTGSTVGTYFPIGGIIASAISKPPGSRDCEVGGSCGVPGLIAVAQSTEGSVANVMGIAEGTLESGLSQADISYWAYQGERIFKDSGPIANLRTIANLYPEAVHIVVRRDSGINSIRELRGKRVSLDREGSGTRVDALSILAAYGLTPEDFEAEALAPGDAADQLRAGKLDAFFLVVGTPAKGIIDLAEDSLISLLPITGPEAEEVRKRYPFFHEDRIAAGTYFNVPSTQTLSLGAQWLVSADVPEDLVYGMTQALWHENTRPLLDNGHPKGRLIDVDSAFDGLVVPMHPGAVRYYLDAGISPPDGTD